MLSQYLKDLQARKLGIKPSADKPEKKPLKKAGKPISKVSKRQAELNAKYLRKIKPYKKKNPFCKARLIGCKTNTTDVHHMKGRGKYLLDESTWLPVCRDCHRTIEQDPQMAKQLGLSASRLAIHDTVDGKKVTVIDKI